MSAEHNNSALSSSRTITTTFCLTCNAEGTITRTVGRYSQTRPCPTCNGSRRMTRLQLAELIVRAAVHYRTYGQCNSLYDDAIAYVTLHKDWSLLHPWMKAVELGPLPPPIAVEVEEQQHEVQRSW